MRRPVGTANRTWLALAADRRRRGLLAARVQFVPRPPTPPKAVINQIGISDEITRKMGAALDGA